VGRHDNEMIKDYLVIGVCSMAVTVVMFLYPPGPTSWHHPRGLLIVLILVVARWAWR